MGNREWADAVVERILRDRPTEWFRDYDQLLLRCFSMQWRKAGGSGA